MSANIMDNLPIVGIIYLAMIGGVVLYFVKLYKVHVRIDQKLALLMEKLDRKEQ